MEESEALYYQCSIRIDDDIEVSDPFMVGCIAYMKRSNGEKGVRRKIKDDISMNYYEPYLRELRFIAAMNKDSLHALITSSLDISAILKQVTIIFNHIKECDFSMVQESTHARKAKRAGEMLMKISEQMRPSTKVRTDSSLFSEAE